MLYSDDKQVRNIATALNVSTGFCTQAFLRVAKEKGYISPNKYHESLLKLFSWNYNFVSEEAPTLVRLTETRDYEIDDLALS